MKRRRSSAILQIDCLGIIRDGVKILRDVSWRVEPGQHWVILGANGSGKTSLLSALTGYFTPTSGDIELLGQRYGESDWRALRTKVGLVSSSVRQMMAESEPALDTVASGKYAMIDFWGTPNRADRLKAARILKQVECAYLADRPWAVLSQGERQRVLIGRAMMAEPSLLILDEPCAGLDPVARESFLEFISRLAKRPNAPTLVFVTHHVEEITPVFTHALLLRGGRVTASGAIRKALTRENVSATFGGPVKLRRHRGRYTLIATARRGKLA
jgi:iron complex transport system ATP-binding protein